MKKNVLSAVVFALCVFVLAGCGGGGGGGSSSNPSPSAGSVRLSGTVGSGYQTAKPSLVAAVLSFAGLGAPAYAVGTDPTVDRVVAIPLVRGTLAAEEMANSVSATINSDKSFSLALSKDRDWVLVLINSAVTDTSRYVGSLAISTGMADSLLTLPATDAAVDSIDLGALDRTGSEAVSVNTVTGSNFNMTAAQLATLAKADNLFKNAKNLINNYNTTTGVFYQMRPGFVWYGDYKAILSAYSTPVTYVLNGYTFQLDTNDPGLTMDNVCGTDIIGNSTTQKTVAVYPPGQVVSKMTLTYDEYTPFSNDGIVCSTKIENGETIRYGMANNDFSATGYSNISFGFPMMDNALTGSVPAGYWSLVTDNTNTLASFDVAIASPINANGLINVPVPVVKLSTSPTGTVTSLDVKWYRLNDAGDGYIEITDPKEVKHLVVSAEWVIESRGSGMSFTREDVNFDPSSTSSFVPAQVWNATSTTVDTAQQVSSVNLFYESGGVGLFFQYHKL